MATQNSFTKARQSFALNITAFTYLFLRILAVLESQIDKLYIFQLYSLQPINERSIIPFSPRWNWHPMGGACQFIISENLTS